MVAKYGSVLSQPGCARVFATALVGRLPQGMSSLAILLLVRGTTHSYAIAGVAVGAYAFATAAAAPLQGRLVDRFGRGRILPPCSILQALALGGLVLAAEAHAAAAVQVALAALAGACLPPIAPAVRALLREVLHDPEIRETAYSLESVVQELIWITGPLLVAVVITVVSPAGAVLLLGLICVAGTLLFVRTPLAGGRGQRAAGRQRTPVLLIPELRALLAPIALMGIGLGAVEVGLPSLALHAGSRPASGLLLALWSLGSLTGGLWYGSRTWRAPLSTRYRTLLLAAVLCTAPLVAARTIPEGMVCSLLAGVTIAPVFSCQYAIIGRAVTPGVETEAFTWVTAALVGGLAAGSAVGGAVIATVGFSAPFVISCVASGIAGLLALRTRHRFEVGDLAAQSSAS